MQDGRKVVWSIPYVSVASFFPSLEQNFIAYLSSKVSSRPLVSFLLLVFFSEHSELAYYEVPKSTSGGVMVSKLD